MHVQIMAPEGNELCSGLIAGVHFAEGIGYPRHAIADHVGCWFIRRGYRIVVDGAVIATEGAWHEHCQLRDHAEKVIAEPKEPKDK
jgi:hypothetical protein